MSYSVTEQGEEIVVHGFPMIRFPNQQADANYISINPFLPNTRSRCQQECGYCVCHQDSEWYHHPERFSDLPSTEALIDTLLEQTFLRRDYSKNPISLYDFTDPFLAAHQNNLLHTIESLSQRQAKNIIYLTTKIHPGIAFLKRLQALLRDCPTLHITIFVSLAPLKPGYETVSVQSRIRLLQELAFLKIPAVWYLRPLTEAWFDEAKLWELARTLLPEYAEHTVLSGVVMSSAIETSLRSKKLVVPEWNRMLHRERLALSPDFELHVRAILRIVANELGLSLGPILPHRQCGVFGFHDYGCLTNHYCALFEKYHNDELEKAEKNSQFKHSMPATSKGPCYLRCDVTF